MKIRKSKIQLVLGIVTVLIVVGAVATGHVPGYMNHSMSRHMQGMMGDVPAPYGEMENPLPATTGVITKGAELFKVNCSVCHGTGGKGDGPEGVNLSPRPSDLTHIMQARLALDGYLFWAISEGGKRFDTAMPAFNGILGEQARWQIIHYLRTLEP